MSEADANSATDQSVEDQNPAAEAPEAWQPEPRTWTWMDIFKAPMIACKFRCMIISIATIAALGAVQFIFGKILPEVHDIAIVGPIIETLACIVPCVIFGLGGTLVAIFIKAELLDDDYPTVKEALGQFKKRILAAIMVPTFLIGALHFMHLGAYAYDLLCSIPYLGSILYFGSIPAFFIWLLITFFSIGVLLSVFVFPSIVAIRKHGWFDNVIDTLEAVGTKPHKVVASILMTMVLMLVCCGIGITALFSAKGLSSSEHIPGSEVQQTEAAANNVLKHTLPAQVNSVIGFVIHFKNNNLSYIGGNVGGGASLGDGEISGYHQYFTGGIAGIFQTIILYLIAGYGLNIIITGGMLTYLHVREDDYWDDEDLADLEKLAKELEEEALKEQGESKTVPAAEEKSDEAKEEAPEKDAKDEAPAEEKEAEQDDDAEEVDVEEASDDDNDDSSSEDEKSDADDEKKE